MKNLCDYSEMECPFHGLLTLLCGTWTTYILWLLSQHSELRFGELKKQMPGLSAKVLTERLRKLEEAGFVTPHPPPPISPKGTYRLSRRGRAVDGPVVQLKSLADSWHSQPRS